MTLLCLFNGNTERRTEMNKEEIKKKNSEEPPKSYSESLTNPNQLTPATLKASFRLSNGITEA